MASKSTSMASVWDTLNKMKARQQAAATSAQKHRQVDTARRDAQQAFEAAVAECGTAEEVFAMMEKEEAVRVVVDAHKERLKGGEHVVTQELDRVRRALEIAEAELSVAVQAIRRGNDAVHRMV